MENHLDRLPHAYPFRMLDRVLELTEEKGVGVKNFSSGADFSYRPFKTPSIVPNFQVIEAMAQISGLVLNYKKESEKSTVVVQIRTMRFRRPVLVSDKIVVASRVESYFASLAVFEVEALVDDDIVATGELVMAQVDVR